MSEFDYRKVSDPLYFKENRLAAHSDHVCFRSWEEERIGQSSLRFSLDGVWKFFYAPTDACAAGLYEKGRRSSRP